MKVTVTGANGFIGSHLLRALLEKDYQPRAMVRPSSNLDNLEGMEAELVYGDLQDLPSMTAAFRGSEMVFHVAGVFTYFGHEPARLIEEARSGMRHVMEAARLAGVRRVVVTSSSVTVGMSRQPKVLREDEAGQFDLAPAYVRAKIAQEELAMEMARAGGPEVVAVLPTLTVGGPDHGLSESNRLIISYLRDHWRSTWIGGCNIVAVEDVCRAHLLAAEQGRSGACYLAGGENLEWTAFHRLISELCGLPGPYIKAYHTSAYLAASIYELASLFSGEPPLSSREQARMVGNYYWYDLGRLSELGYRPRSAREALAAAISWLVGSAHLPASIRSTLNLSPEIYDLRK